MLAKKRGDTLLFLYVVDMRFLNKTAGPIVVDVENEITKMGEFLLLMAKERAAEQGVVAETISRSGNLRAELKDAAREEGISLVLLGRPSGEQSVFRLADLQAFAAEIEAETGVETRITGDEESPALP
jgi:nucleotide-binding universal stress UspA family protein